MSDMTSDVYVLVEDHGDGSAHATVDFADEDHRFSITTREGEAVIEYEETQSWRGTIRTREPDEVVYRELMSSDEMTRFLEANNLDSVTRERR